MFVLSVVNKDKRAKCRKSRKRNKYGLSKKTVQENTRKTPVGTRFFGSIQIGPEDHPVSCKMGAGCLSQGYSGRGVALTTHPLLAPELRMGTSPLCLLAYLYFPYFLIDLDEVGIDLHLMSLSGCQFRKIRCSQGIALLKSAKNY